jgi:hypothetical protein
MSRKCPFCASFEGHVPGCYTQDRSAQLADLAEHKALMKFEIRDHFGKLLETARTEFDATVRGGSLGFTADTPLSIESPEEERVTHRVTREFACVRTVPLPIDAGRRLYAAMHRRTPASQIEAPAPTAKDATPCDLSAARDGAGPAL